MYLSAQLHRTAVLCPPTQVPASVRCRRCSGRRPRTRRSGRHRGRSAWPLGGWRPRCRTARCLLCERRGALPLGLRLLGVLPRLASRAQRALRARVVPAAVLIVPAAPARPPLLDFCASAVEVLQSNAEALGVSEPECGRTPHTLQTLFSSKGLGVRLSVGTYLFFSTYWTPRIFQYLLDPQN